MQQNDTDMSRASRTTAAPKGEKDRMHEAMESVERIRRQAVTRRIHALQASHSER
jgi:hypothetical protein